MALIIKKKIICLSPKGTRAIPGDVFSIAPLHIFEVSVRLGERRFEKKMINERKKNDPVAMMATKH